MKSLPIWLWLAGVALLDQASKWWVRSSFFLHESRELIPGFFNLTHIVNTGAAFGLLAGEPTVVRQLFFTGVALVALVAIVFIHRQVREQHPLFVHALGLIAGGAVGNLIDRVRFGGVTDFLDFYLGKYHWPAFNVADSAITVGVVLFLLAGWWAARKEIQGV